MHEALDLGLSDKGVDAGVLERARVRQAERGGSYDTALLEEGVDETVILEVLAAVNDLPTIGREVAELDHGAIALFPERLADRHALLPVRAEGRRLFLASPRRFDPALLDEIGFMLSLYIKPVITTEARFAQGMWLRYGELPSARLAAILRGLGEKVPDPEPEVTEDPSADPWDEATVLSLDGFEEVSDEMFGAELEVVEPEAPEPVAAPGSDGDALDDHRRKERVKWSVDDAIAEIALAGGRDEMIDALLRFAHRRLDTTVVFIARTEGEKITFQAWDGIDPSRGREVLKAIRVEDGPDHALGKVAETRAPYLGPMAEDDPLTLALGRRSRASVLVPVLVGDRLAGIVYGDCGARSIPPASVAELHMVVPRFGTALRNLILRARRRRPPPQAVPSALEAADEIDFTATSAGSFVGDEADAGDDLPIEVDTRALDSAPRLAPRAPAGELTLPPLSSAPAPSPGASAREVLLTATWRAWRTHDDRAADEAIASVGRDPSLSHAPLLGHGLRLLPALSRAFPGVLLQRPFAAGLSATTLANEPAAISVVADMLIRLGPDLAAPIVVGELEHDERNHRIVAVALMAASHMPGGLIRLADRVYDPELRIAHLAVLALERYRKEHAFERVLDNMRRTCRFHREAFRRRRAIVALTELRDRGAMPAFIHLLGTEPRDVSEEAHRALVDLTKQDFGQIARRWGAWLADHGGEPRVKWLIDGLSHRDRRVRASAQLELNAETSQNFGYQADAPRSEREQSVNAWRAWYEQQGPSVAGAKGQGPTVAADEQPGPAAPGAKTP